MREWQRRLRAIQGWFDDREMRIMLELAEAVPQGGTVVEVGVWKGRCFCAMGTVTEGKRHVAVDHFRGSHETWHWEDPDLPRLRQVFEENLARYGMDDRAVVVALESADAAATFENESIDLLLLDAGHETEDIERDVDLWWPKVKVGGTVAFHDWDKPWTREGIENKLKELADMEGEVRTPYLFVAEKK